MHLADFPEDVIKHYKLKELANKEGMVFVEIQKGMYGLPQEGLLAQELLKKWLNKHEYFQSTRTPGLWRHKWRPTQFTLVVDDSGIKYVGDENLQHLTTVLREHYEISIDRTGAWYIGIHLIGTMNNAKYTSQCQDMSRKCWHDFNIFYQINHKINPTHTSHQNVEQKYNMQNQWIHRQNSTKTKNSSSKK